MPIISQDTVDSSVAKAPVCKQDLLDALHEVKKIIDEMQTILHRQLLKYDSHKKTKSLDDLSDQHHCAHCDALISVHHLKRMIDSIPTQAE